MLTVKVAESDFLPEYNQRVKEQAKRANFKGFRAGKVPASLVKKMVGKDLKMDVFNATVSESVDQYLKENNVNAMFQPMFKGDFLTPEQLDAAKEFTLEFELVVPEVDLTLSEEISVKGYELNVSDADIDNTVNRLIEAYPNEVEAEEVAEGDNVVATFKAASNDFEKEATLELNEKVQEEVRKAFIGKKVGEEVTFEAEKVYEDPKKLRLLFGGTQEESENFTGEFTATISAIKRKEAPELNQEFFDKVLGEEKASNEEEFRAEIATLIGDANKPSIEAFLNDSIRDEISEKVEISFPEELLKRILNSSNDNKLSDEEIEEKFPNFLKAVKWRAISNKVAESAEIKVEHNEIEAIAKEQIAAQMAQFGMGDLPEERLTEFVQNQLTAENGKYYQEYYEQVFNNKLFDYIQEQITIASESVDLAKFEEIMKAKMDQEQA
ncbi:trigger factor [Algivirga pacifica]|uniref:Trigger factor n=1 Tax=Algivirga pacifica TaxID=1162670 RepID=A0ABP9D3P6_9BACT